jgi:ligand-binding sensor domain-containing protein
MGLQGVDVAYNPNYVVSMKVDADGVVWAGTWGGGLARFDGRRWTNFTTAEGLPGNHVFMLHVGPKGRLWVGTNNGLASFTDGKFAVRTVADGLIGNAVFSMASGADGTHWVGSFGGVAHLRRLPAD